MDYRLFDIQHAVLPTALPLDVFSAELVRTQAVINRKHLGLSTLLQVSGIAGRLLHGQTNFIRMLWRFNRVYNGTRQLADHQRPVRYGRGRQREGVWRGAGPRPGRGAPRLSRVPNDTGHAATPLTRA
jgi:magnesium-protoporphyrin IX monomethyl ester (oxidative) cyclase